MNMASSFKEGLSHQLKSTQDYEERLRRLRLFSRQEKITLQKKFTNRKIPLPELFQELTALAEAVLFGSQFTAQEELLKTDLPPPQDSFAVVAMGKFGGKELTFYSDLDLIFIFKNSEDREYYNRLARRIISALTLLTTEGYAYQVDTELRPSGNAGMLVSSLEGFYDYHRKLGRHWERQSLIKARPVLGETNFLSEVHQIIEEIVYIPNEKKDLAQEIDSLRKRMEMEIAQETKGTYNIKTGYGGLLDIEFSIQYLQLLHGFELPTLRKNNTQEALHSLTKAEFISKNTSKELEKAYFFYRELETELRLLYEYSTDTLREKDEKISPLKEKIPDYLKTREFVRTFYQAIFGLSL